ncbi:phage tail tip domain-containing protein [Shigella flexneri]
MKAISLKQWQPFHGLPGTGRWPSGTITVRVYDDQPFDRQIVIPAVAFRGA